MEKVITVELEDITLKLVPTRYGISKAWNNGLAENFDSETENPATFTYACFFALLLKYQPNITFAKATRLYDTILEEYETEFVEELNNKMIEVFKNFIQEKEEKETKPKKKGKISL